LLGWLTAARGGRRSTHDKPPSETWRRAIKASLVVGAIGAAIAAPIISVLWVVVALNLLLGSRENVPFSTYSMFSRPSAIAWALRFENRQGELIPIATMGLAPHIMRKRFVSELRAARRRGVRDVDAARLDAASVLATLVEDRRPSGGPLATKPIAIVLVEYSLDSGKVRQEKKHIMETSP
jgi:hypothetical protein